MVPNSKQRVVILIGGGPSTGDVMYQIEGTAELLISSPYSTCSPAPPTSNAEAAEAAPKKLSWKAEQKRLPKFLK